MRSLILKSILGLAFLMLVMAVTLFLSAGSLSFWQAWVYLSIFTICTVLITGYLLKYDQKLLARRAKAGPTAETQRSQQVIQSLASLFFIGVFVVAGLDYRFHWSHVLPVVSLTADVFITLGFLIVFLVFRANSYTSAVIEVAREQQVIATGPYRMVRHPMYSGASLLLIFTPLALGSWVALPLSMVLILIVVIRLVAEEKFLSANLVGYKAYLQATRYRLVPLIW